jgi:phage host-nuclease inhibitor protein Gam
MTTKLRIKKAAEAVTRETAERLVREIAELTLEERERKNEIDAAILAAKERHAARLAEIAELVRDKTELVQAWAEGSPADFGKAKSMAFPAGRVGFRTGTPKLKTLAGWTFARVLDKLKSLPWGAAFVRVKEETDKEGILSAYAARTLSDGELREVGCRVVQEESFYIEPDLATVGTRIQEAA